jgi:hypothetical protein
MEAAIVSSSSNIKLGKYYLDVGKVRPGNPNVLLIGFYPIIPVIIHGHTETNFDSQATIPLTS